MLFWSMCNIPTAYFGSVITFSTVNVVNMYVLCLFNYETFRTETDNLCVVKINCKEPI